MPLRTVYEAAQRAFARVRRDTPRRAALLGLGFLVFVAVIPIAVSFGLESLADLPGLWFVNVLEPAVTDVLLGTLSTALITVAAADYRLRSEGTDLAAALDGAGGSARG